MGFHAEYTTGRKVMEGIAELAQKYQAPVFTHNAETKKEVDECIARYGMTPTMFNGLYGNVYVWRWWIPLCLAE